MCRPTELRDNPNTGRSAKKTRIAGYQRWETDRPTMNKFSPQTRAAYPELDLTFLEGQLVNLEARKIAELDGFLLSPASMLPAAVLDLVQCGLRRTLAVVDVSIREINEQHPITACVLVRAAFETACLINDLAVKTMNLAESKDTAELPEFELHVKRAAGGGRFGGIQSVGVRRLRIGKVIDRVSFELGGIPKRNYNLLSEFAHPNYPGMLAAYKEVGKKGCVTTFTECECDIRHQIVGIAVGSLFATSEVFDLAFKALVPSLKEFVMLCERWNHERGKWPTDLPFPIPR